MVKRYISPIEPIKEKKSDLEQSYNLALQTIKLALQDLNIKQLTHKTLSPTDQQALIGYARVLSTIQKEEREKTKALDLTKMLPEQLEKMIEEMGYVKVQNKKNE